MIQDEVFVTLKAGNGGDGVVKFGKGTKGRPTGGNGGWGGDLYLEGTTDIADLRFINPGQTFAAENGEPGGVNNSKGAEGKEFTLKVPLITEVYNENGELVATIKEKGERILLLKGGRGGLGNHHFRSGQTQTLTTSTKGKSGEILSAKLILKLQADIVFIGFPNAGKSSMLNILTNAQVKVGNYPFTTLSPHLGALPGIRLMDLPGLIVGTSKGKGLGSGFIKHTEYAKLVAHFLSLESQDILKDYTEMRQELNAIDQKLAKKPEVIILTKSDILSEQEINDKIDTIKSLGKEYVLTTIFDDTSVEKVKEFFKKILTTI